MSVLYYSLKTELYLKIQDFKFFLSIALVSMLLFLLTPARESGWIPLVVNSYTSYYSSAFLGLHSAITIAFLFTIGGIYLIIGRISEDYTSGVGQVLASTHMNNQNYIWTRLFSHALTLFSIDIFAILISIFLQFYHGEVTEFSAIDYLLPHVIFVWPVIAMVSMVAIFCELYFRNNLQLVYVTYFFLIAAAIMGLLFSGMDLFGFDAFTRYLTENGYITGASDFSILRDGDDIVFVDFTGISLGLEVLVSRLIIIGVTLLFYVLSVIRFDRFDPSKWSISLSKMLQLDQNVEEENRETAVFVSYATLPVALRSAGLSSYLTLLRSEFMMGFPRSKLYIITVIVMNLVSLSGPSPTTVATSFILVAIPLSRIFSRDFGTGTKQLILAMPQAEKRVDLVRFTTGVLMVLLVTSGTFIGFISSGNIHQATLTILSCLFLVSMAYGLIVFLESDKAFLGFFIFMWYLSTNGMRFADFMFTENSDTTLVMIYSLLTIVLTFLGIASTNLRKH